LFDPNCFVKALRLLEGMSDHLCIQTREDGLVEVSADGDDMFGVFVFGKLESKPIGTCRSLFPMDYISSLMKSCTCMNKMSMRMGNDMPLSWRGLALDMLEVHMMLAPRIQDED
jgi:hypothetical protein